MRFKDFVANSLPRVRGRKNKKASSQLQSAPNHGVSMTTSAIHEPDFSTCPRYFPQQHPLLDSRESSVERSSTVAVVDAPWRENAVYKSKGHRPGHADVCAVSQPLTYYTPPHPHRGMVMSHSADGISSHQASMAMLMATSSRGYLNGSKVTTISDHYASGGGYQYNDVSAMSESAVNYIAPYCFYHAQHQHQHHHHHHSHDHHYVYHHHHDRHHQPQPQTQPPKTTPLAEKNHHQQHHQQQQQQQQQPVTNFQIQNPDRSEKPRKSESGGFLRRSFASFRAMRKPRSQSKEQENHPVVAYDENDKCVVCPYPQHQPQPQPQSQPQSQPQNTATDKNSSQRKALKQSRKGLKSLTKSKKKKSSASNNSSSQNHQNDTSWYSDNDAQQFGQTQACRLDALPYATVNQFPVRECSMEHSIIHPNGGVEAGSREGSCIREFENPQYQETVSLSGYDSDVTKNRTGRSRSRIKTNPWLPSPQPSMSMGRRIGGGHLALESHDDFMEEDNPSCFPRSVSFDYPSHLGISSFLSSSGQDEPKRNIQRHRSLTPIDLKINLSLPKTKKSEPSKTSIESLKTFSKKESDLPPEKSGMNDLNTKLTKSRPNSIVSPNSEFITLADNIEQLANNISFEYEYPLDATPDCELVHPKDGAFSMGKQRPSGENNGLKNHNCDMNSFSGENISENAHSPDSGIGCLGSCDGDDSMALGNSVGSEASSTPVTPLADASISPSLSNASDSFPRSASVNSNLNQSNNKLTEKVDIKDSASSQNKPEGQFVGQFNATGGSPGGVSISRIHASSSNESLNSAVVSESDIDNTSYRYADIATQPCIATDPPKPINAIGSLMVDERLDIDFRSLPRKTARTYIRNGGVKTLCRNKTVTDSRLMTVSMESESAPLQTAQSEKDAFSSFMREVEKSNKLKTKHPAHPCSNHTRKEMKSRESGCNSEMEVRPEDSIVPSSSSTQSMLPCGSGMVDSHSSHAVTTDTASFMCDVNNEQYPTDSKTVNDVTMKVQERFTQQGGLHESSNCQQSAEIQTVSAMDFAFSKENFVNSYTDVISVSDTADVSVQTDFCLDFVDPWDMRPTSPLPQMEDSFDPLESTRRWLISGNMQGSADTGYSSQARDSHVFMDEESSLPLFDSLSDNGVTQCQTKPKTKVDSPTNKVKLVSDVEVSPSPSFFRAISASSTSSVGNPQNHQDDAANISSLNSLLSGKDCQRQETFNKEIVLRNNNGNAPDVTKRHSSDSSTSTLTSDIPVLESRDNLNLHFDQITSHTIADFGQINKGMEDHDYVNFPLQDSSNEECPQQHVCVGTSAFNAKSEIEPPYRNCDSLNGYSSHCSSLISNATPKYTAQCKDDHEDVNPFRCVESLSYNTDDKADYLEFLRDAPLQTSYQDSRVFIIPGFGPLAVPYEMLDRKTMDRDIGGHAYGFGNGGSYSPSEMFDSIARHIEIETADERKSLALVAQSQEAVSVCRRKTCKTSKPKRDEKTQCVSNDGVGESRHDDHNAEKSRSQQSCQPCQTKRTKSNVTKDNIKSHRCPTVQSYEVDNFSPAPCMPGQCLHAGQCREASPPSSFHHEKSRGSIKDKENSSNSTRTLAERVSILRHEKEIIYRKIQEVQQQEMSKQREQLQHQRHLHSQRKEELLETLHDLKEKLEEHSRRLQLRCREEI